MWWSKYQKIDSYDSNCDRAPCNKLLISKEKDSTTRFSSNGQMCWNLSEPVRCTWHVMSQIKFIYYSHALLLLTGGLLSCACLNKNILNILCAAFWHLKWGAIQINKSNPLPFLWLLSSVNPHACLSLLDTGTTYSCGWLLVSESQGFRLVIREYCLERVSSTWEADSVLHSLSLHTKWDVYLHKLSPVTASHTQGPEVTFMTPNLKDIYLSMNNEWLQI